MRLGRALLSSHQEVSHRLRSGKIKDIIAKSPDVETVRVQMSEMVLSIVQRLRQSRGGAVLVTEDHDSCGKALTGIFTERDLCDLLLRGANLKTTTVGSEMSKDVVTATPDMSVIDAIKLLLDNRIHHLPVADFIGDAIDKDSRVTHILTSNDILSFLLAEGEYAM
jgi:CBS domain-containing protein